MFGSAIVLGLLGLPLMLLGRRPSLRVMQIWARGVLAALRILVGAQVTVRGREHLAPGGRLVAAKHQGMLDILIGLAMLPEPCIVLKQELMRLPIFGWYAWRTGMIPIRRDGGPTALRAMSAAARAALADGRQVLIYPEGTRKAPGAPPDYKSGVAALYRELQAPCTPLATNSGQVWPAHGMAKWSGEAVFEFLPPIAPGLKRAVFMAELQGRLEAASTALLSP